eukprot:CAMPEP_0171086492 /NCGR_PEP_ID=MMETSP0766_2-20121228/19573_1 /TAXON_ID=439317 /ORGANISM="Gambierdiscus australes, Strain CAWD 149" /LENGTH=35 /DNA_ID= /DNA_START= /DNA_END= /DNA_ORIENTATION=
MKVFPAPVWPKATTEPVPPSTAVSTRPLQALKISS